MSSELYEQFAEINKIDQAIFEAESEIEEGARPLSLNASGFLHAGVIMN